jgi:hypothetical protein
MFFHFSLDMWSDFTYNGTCDLGYTCSLFIHQHDDNVMRYYSLNHDQHGRKIKRKKPKGVVCGKYKATEFKPFEPSTTKTYADLRMAESKQYPSHDSGTFNTTKKERPQYTGTLVKGISTMHKSNAVPIINKEQATEISRMAK